MQATVQSLPHSPKFLQCLDAYRAYKTETSVQNADAYDNALEALAYERKIDTADAEYVDLIGEVMQAAAVKPVAAIKPVYLTREQKAERMGRDGYGLSEDRLFPGLYIVHKPGVTNGRGYRVDFRRKSPTCDCYYNRRHDAACKHICWVRKCLRYADFLRCKEAILPVRKQRFSLKHVQAIRGISA